MNAARHRLAPSRPHGSVSVPFALMLPVLLGFMGLAIDLSMLYARNAELQHVVDGAAVAAARELNGTAAGVARARTKAIDMAEANTFKLSTTSFADGQSWSSAVLYLSAAPAGEPWVAADAVNDNASAAPLLYAKVDSAALGSLSGAPGVVATSFMRALGVDPQNSAVPVAIAGRIGMQATPLGICALNPTRIGQRASGAGTELVELGYRRGVSYDLLRLNPGGPAAQNFLINPVAAGNATSLAAQFSASALKPFFCSGSVAFANLRPGATVHVQPLAGLDLHDWLNARFGVYPGAAGCNSRDSAPPDVNVREFKNPYNWMPTTLPAALSATAGAAPNALLTVADLASGAASTADPVTAVKYGPLWIYKGAVRYSAVAANNVGAQFAIADWAALYPVPAATLPKVRASAYLATPYVRQFTAPSSGISYAERRVLNIPLLDCSSAVGATASVLGIGRFFMTSHATASAIYAEFAGLASDEKLALSIALHK